MGHDPCLTIDRKTSKPGELRFATNDYPRFPAFILKIFLNFLAINLTEPENFPKNAKSWKSVRAFWSYSARKENPTYFYIID
uniref:SFRICE_018145 n=1 Tax=Spodoptera frugiperda TaxID=7108 RepID=A0A2H1WI42_SPOFR